MHVNVFLYTNTFMYTCYVHMYKFIYIFKCPSTYECMQIHLSTFACAYLLSVGVHVCTQVSTGMYDQYL